MDAPDTPHAGIELDAMCLPALGREAGDKDVAEIQSDASDYSLFVNSIFKSDLISSIKYSISGRIILIGKCL